MQCIVSQFCSDLKKLIKQISMLQSACLPNNSLKVLSKVARHNSKWLHRSCWNCYHPMDTRSTGKTILALQWLALACLGQARLPWRLPCKSSWTENVTTASRYSTLPRKTQTLKFGRGHFRRVTFPGTTFWHFSMLGGIVQGRTYHWPCSTGGLIP